MTKFRVVCSISLMYNLVWERQLTQKSLLLLYVLDYYLFSQYVSVSYKLNSKFIWESCFQLHCRVYSSFFASYFNFNVFAWCWDISRDYIFFVMAFFMIQVFELFENIFQFDISVFILKERKYDLPPDAGTIFSFGLSFTFRKALVSYYSYFS